jgi:hypothetical protein
VEKLVVKQEQPKSNVVSVVKGELSKLAEDMKK